MPKPTERSMPKFEGIITRKLNKALRIACLSLALSASLTSKTRAEDTGGYPWTDAQYIGIATDPTQMYDWGYPAATAPYKTRPKIFNGQQYYMGDSEGYDVRNCTSYVAWRIGKEFGINIPGWGNANNWDNAAAGKFNVDTTPEAGDIAVWEGSYGHVAYVESTNKDGSVNVAEYNHDEHGNFDRRGEAYDGQKVVADHYIDINGVGNIWNGPSNNNAGSTAYSAVPENGLLTDGNWVYDKVGGSAWPIKPKSQWSASDANYWGGNPVNVSTIDVHNHEVGYDQNGRNYGAHPPQDTTAVKIDGGSGDVYDFVGGNAYKIGSMGELAILGIAKVQRVPGTGNRLDDFIGKPLKLPSGTMYRFADISQVRIFAQQPDGSNPAMLVPNETSLDCFESVQGKNLRILPDSTQQYLFGQNGLPINESSLQAGCGFPGNWVMNAPSSQERWYIGGDGVSSAYHRHYYPNLLSMYVDTGGSPFLHTMRSVDALNGAPRGADMATNPHSFFRNSSSGNIYWWGDDNVAHKVQSMDSLSCMGGPNVINVPAEALVGVPEGNAAQCAFEGKLLHDTNDGSVWYIKDGQRHYVLNMAIAYGLEGRVASTQGRMTDASDANIKTYSPGAATFVPYGPPVFLKYSGDPSVWLTLPDGTRKHAMSLCNGANVLTVPTGEFDGHVDTGNWSANPTDCNKIANGQNIN
jgi:surface antigen